MLTGEAGRNTDSHIKVRSKKQALDWSLVLASQYIEAAVLPPDEEHGWRLSVSSQDAERAFKALRLYRAENRGWPVWHGGSVWPGAPAFDWRCLIWALLLVAVYWIGETNAGLAERGMLNGIAVRSGQWWRVFTAMQLHENIGHLATNLSVGMLLFGLVMGHSGAGLGLLVPYLSGAIGNLFSLFVNGNHFYGLGASGMVMGALGMLASQTVVYGVRSRRITKQSLAGLAAGIMLFAFYGTAPGSDIAAHLGGFTAGFVLGVLLAFAPDNPAWRHNANRLSVLILTGLLTATWWLALNNLAKK